jgi:ABC-type antimicrobial peptide transport system, ATPase component
MAENGQALIKLDGVTKVFFTDESRRTRCRGSTCRSTKASTSRLPGRRAAASRRCSPFSAFSTRPPKEFTLNNRPVAELAASERARVRNREIGFIFQSFNLIGDLTVFENVELPLTYRGMKAAERKQRVEAALERVGMAHRAKHLPASSPAVSSSASPWRAPSPASRSSCSRTSRPATSTRAAAKR